jgi:hypothetical protein
MTTELEKLAALARAKVQASGLGCMHSMWDVILDAEALISGRRSILNEAQTLAYLREYLGAKG